MFRSILQRFLTQNITHKPRGLSNNMSIEVEQKFYFDSETEKKLLQLGALSIAEITQRDIYYDTPTYQLTCLDHWLRQRNGQWELKCPPEKRHSGSNTTQYQEFNKECEITPKILPVMKVQDLDSDSFTLESILRRADCTPFTDITTHRKKYKLDDICVDLDVVDYGYRLGEIEVLVDKDEDIPEANRKIQELTTKIGAEITSYIPGKVLVYLWKFRKDHHKALVQSNVILTIPPELLARLDDIK